MNIELRNTTDEFISSIYSDINTAQNTYKATIRDDARYPDGRYFNTTKTHNSSPEDGELLSPDNTWEYVTLPETLPCSMQALVLEHNNDMGWVLIIEYIDSGIQYRKTIDTLNVIGTDWEEVTNV